MLEKLVMSYKTVALVILDGYGIGPEEAPDNAIARANTPVMDSLMENYFHVPIHTSGRAVGLPEGQMGNSEVGHKNIGAGRVIRTDQVRIDDAILPDANGDIAGSEIARNAQMQAMVAELKESGGTCHIMGLLSDGGVHSLMDHLIALCKIMEANKIPYRVHAFLDGRDTAPESALDFLKTFEASVPAEAIATVSGRYYAMDRDKKWDRTELAYRAIAEGESDAVPRFATAAQAVEQSYAAGRTDEFVLPAVIGDYQKMEKNDAMIMANFRPDRARQMLTAFVDPHFKGFERGEDFQPVPVLGMTSYGKEIDPLMTNLFPPENIVHSMGEVVSNEGREQFRTAETEKYPHVTYFLNGGVEEPFLGETRKIVASPNVATYDRQPEMSAGEVTKNVVDAIQSGKYSLVVVNFANCDMVGHTGNMEAAKKAVETVDQAVGEIVEAIQAQGGAVVITADHGNAEQMIAELRKPDGSIEKIPFTQHTTNPVPMIIVAPEYAIGHYSMTAASENLVEMAQEGKLADVAPTVLDLMGLPKPAEMTGHSFAR
jgi:2,3-bisphosphoglycerate-independent phosphoglycerate mutase